MANRINSFLPKLIVFTVLVCTVASCLGRKHDDRCRTTFRSSVYGDREYAMEYVVVGESEDEALELFVNSLSNVFILKTRIEDERKALDDTMEDAYLSVNEPYVSGIKKAIYVDEYCMAVHQKTADANLYRLMQLRGKK